MQFLRHEDLPRKRCQVRGQGRKNILLLEKKDKNAPLQKGKTNVVDMDHRMENQKQKGKIRKGSQEKNQKNYQKTEKKCRKLNLFFSIYHAGITDYQRKKIITETLTDSQILSFCKILKY